MNCITTPMLLQLDSIVLYLPLTAVCRSRSSLFMSWILSVVLCAPLCPSVVNVFLGAELAKTTTTSYNSRHSLIGATKSCCAPVAQRLEHEIKVLGTAKWNSGKTCNSIL